MPVVGNRSPLRYMTMMTSSCLHSSPARVLTLPLISPAGERVKIPSTVLSHPSCSVYWFPTFASASLFIPHGQAVNFFVHVARGARALGMERPSALSPKSPRRSTLDPRPSTAPTDEPDATLRLASRARLLIRLHSEQLNAFPIFPVPSFESFRALVVHPLFYSTIVSCIVS